MPKKKRREWQSKKFCLKVNYSKKKNNRFTEHGKNNSNIISYIDYFAC